MKDNQSLDPHMLRKKKYTELDNNLSKMYQNVKKIKPNNSDFIYYMKKLEATRAIGSAASAKMLLNVTSCLCYNQSAKIYLQSVRRKPGAMFMR